MRLLLSSIAALVTATLLPAEKNKEEWTLLFDGKSTHGWTPRAKVESFVAKDGELQLFSKVSVWVVSDLENERFRGRGGGQDSPRLHGLQFGPGFQVGWRQRQTQGLPL